MVNASTIGWGVFALVFGSAVATMYVRKMLPESLLNTDSKDTIRLSVALVATMEALVLSLLIASAKSSYDTRQRHLAELSADIVILDEDLARYGTETKQARALLVSSLSEMIERFWSVKGTSPPGVTPGHPIDALYDAIDALSPQNDGQRALREQALKTAREVNYTRALLFGNLGASIPIPFLIILVFWLCLIFASYGLFAPRNVPVVIVLCVCALSVSGAIFLILDLDRSIGGLLQVPDASLRAALAQLGR